MKHLELQWDPRWLVLLVAALLIVFMLGSMSEAPYVEETTTSDTIYVEKRVYIDTNYLFDEALAHLKEYEGFRANMYYDVDGSKTIGYGHHFKKGENFSVITEGSATDLLVTDLQRYIDYVEKETDLRGNKSLALGLFTFNVGTGNFNKAIARGLLSNINRITKYCHYRDGERVIRSQKLLERREFELYIYNK